MFAKRPRHSLVVTAHERVNTQRAQSQEASRSLSYRRRLPAFLNLGRAAPKPRIRLFYSHHRLRLSSACQMYARSSKTVSLCLPTTPRSLCPVPTFCIYLARYAFFLTHPTQHPVLPAPKLQPENQPGSSSSTAQPISDQTTGTGSSPYSQPVKPGNLSPTSGPLRQNSSSTQVASTSAGAAKGSRAKSAAGAVESKASPWSGGTKRAAFTVQDGGEIVK